ncbi:MAG TPA: YezD family protein [Candidatus Acidoferrales bacterium]|nr:YezD family protein [Candidatus Acidoferrales bacterium]
MTQTRDNAMESCQADSEMLKTLSPSERALVIEILHALRTIRYGSVSLTFHEGRVVEINKTKRIRLTPRSVPQ